MGALKAISMWQPWGSLWLSPNKPHETRHGQTRHRGRLLVHAAKKLVKDVDAELAVENEFGRRWQMDLPTGAIIGMVI
jgi:activating signal cointegrator 1